MKESNFYSDEFEQLIREKTEQYKMYPSENVWKGVHNSLHTKRRWFIGSMAVLVGGILFFAGRELIAPSPHPVLAAKNITAANAPAPPSKPATTGPLRHSVLTTDHTGTPVAGTTRHDSPGATGEVAEDQSYKGVTITLSNLVISQPDLSEFLSHAVHLPDHAPALAVITPKVVTIGDAGLTRVAEDGSTGLASPINPAVRAGEGQAMHGGDAAIQAGRAGEGLATRTGTDNGAGRVMHGVAEAGRNDGGETTDETAGLTGQSVVESLSAKGVQAARNKKAGRDLARIKPGGSSLAAKGALSNEAAADKKATATTIAENADRQRIYWLHDYAMYTLPASEKQSRTFLQLTLSPTVNYRSLKGTDYSQAKFIPNAPLALNHPGDAQRYVDHSPALGFTVGGSLLYRVTRNLSIKGGLQFNFSRYKIKAYASNPQQATIALSSYYGYIIDSLTSYTSIGNFGGRTQQTINNDYYQLSAPVGFELRVLGNERLQFNIGGTVQPSYLLNTNSYMLTSDYTGYTKQPSLLRRWNVSGALEAFLTYKVGNLRLQAGPEFRYQLLSTYTNKYPFNENLKGYGFKIGIVKELP
jgi:hypothetical protein